MNNKLPFPIGFEMTGIRKQYNAHAPGNSGRKLDKEGNRLPTPDQINEVLCASIGKLIGFELEKQWPKWFSFSRVYKDIHCIEFPSPIFDRLGGIKHFYQRVRQQFDRYDVLPRNPTCVCGGNHLHFELADLNWIRKIFRDFAQRPWIPWIFTQPDDTDSCNNWEDSKVGLAIRTHIELLEKMAKDPGGYYHNSPSAKAQHWMFAEKGNVAIDSHTLDCMGCITDSKSDAVTFEYEFSLRGRQDRRYKDNKVFVLEYRCVEAPLDFDEFMDQLEFFVRYTNYVKARPLPDPITKFPSHRELQRIRRAKCVKEFYGLLNELGLDPKRYEKYVRRNLYARWEMKRQRF